MIPEVHTTLARK